MPEHNIPGVLGRSIGVALTAALRAELMLIYVGAQRHGIALHIAHVDPAFDHPEPRAVRRQIYAGALRCRRRGGKEGRGVRRYAARVFHARLPQPAIAAGARRSRRPLQRRSLRRHVRARLGDTDRHAPSQPEHREVACDEGHEAGVGRRVALDQQTETDRERLTNSKQMMNVNSRRMVAPCASTVRLQDWARRGGGINSRRDDRSRLQPRA